MQLVHFFSSQAHSRAGKSNLLCISTTGVFILKKKMKQPPFFNSIPPPPKVSDFLVQFLSRGAEDLFETWQPRTPAYIRSLGWRINV